MIEMKLTRRDFIKSNAVAAAATVAGVSLPAALTIVAVGVAFIVTEVLLLRGVSLDAPFRRRSGEWT